MIVSVPPDWANNGPGTRIVRQFWAILATDCYRLCMLKKYQKQGPSPWDRKLVIVLGALFAITLLLFAVWAVTLLAEASAVDSCLDKGGSYDYERQRCDFETTHPVP